MSSHRTEHSQLGKARRQQAPRPPMAIGNRKQIGQIRLNYFNNLVKRSCLKKYSPKMAF